MALSEYIEVVDVCGVDTGIMTFCGILVRFDAVGISIAAVVISIGYVDVVDVWSRVTVAVTARAI